MPTLLLSSRITEDNQALWRATVQREWNVERAKGLRIPDLIDDDIVLYIESLYAHSIADTLNLQLVSIPEDWLTTLPYDFVRRRIDLSNIGAARRLAEPTFIKPPNDKSFSAKVYASGESLPDFLDDAAPAILSEPVTWTVEFRCFVLDGHVCTISPYWRDQRPASDDNFTATDEERMAATSLAETVLAAPGVACPPACVIDVGQLSDGAWAVVEANAAWGSGIYGCDPNAVLDVLRRATTQS